MSIPSSQTNKKTPFPFFATSIGATIDSFYRSAMNSFLNASLTNKRGALFPNMHIQTPFRVVYLNGIKNIRLYLDNEKPKLIQQGYDPNLVRYSMAIAPGVIMTPFSSVLEASNAAHMNPEPIMKRWARGLVPRTVREVIFAVGLNQVSDACEKSVPASIQNQAMRNVAGSISAGVLAGYFSHVPHNLSSLKLLQPSLSYSEHFGSLVEKSLTRFKFLGLQSRSMATLFVFLFPKGVMIRTAQIVGTFVIVNGTISVLSKYDLDSKIKTMYAPQKKEITF